MEHEVWTGLLGSDPRPWLLSSPEPYARWTVLTELMDLPPSNAQVEECREAVLRDPSVGELMTRLPDWEVDNKVPGHNSPRFAPNLLSLLADMGVQASDDFRIGRLLEQMLAHRTDDGHFAAFDDAGWGWVLCDTHAVTEVLMRYGYLTGREAVDAWATMERDMASTDQGVAWGCVPHTVTRFRGPGRKSEMCPQVTVEALRAVSYMDEAGGANASHPAFLNAAKSLVGAWMSRGEKKPYMFGHGINFKTVKWPNFWYSVASVLDCLGRFPLVWSGPEADDGIVSAVAELAAVMVAYNFNPDGKVTPHSCYKGFEGFSFGQKKEPSPFATARLCAILRRFEPIAPLIGSIDVLALSGSKGGTGTVVPPKVRALPKRR